MDIYDGVAVAAVVGYVNIISSCLPEKFLAWKGTKIVASVVCGCLYSISIRTPDVDGTILQTLTTGVMVGLLAVGGYNGVKSIANK